MNQSATPTETAFAALDDQIAFVLDHPSMSDWVKQALTGALSRPPIDVLNDLEILNQILVPRSKLLAGDAAFGVCGSGEG